MTMKTEQGFTPELVERVRFAIGNAGRETSVNTLGYYLRRGMLEVDPEADDAHADAVLREAGQRALEASGIEELTEALRRTTDVAENLAGELTDPGTEALGAIYCSRALLAKIGGNQ